MTITRFIDLSFSFLSNVFTMLFDYVLLTFEPIYVIFLLILAIVAVLGVFYVFR